MKLPWPQVKPAPPAFGRGKTIPEQQASFVSRIILHWVDPFLRVGFSRPLEKDDLWELSPGAQAATITDRLESSFYTRCPPEERPSYLRRDIDSTKLRKPSDFKQDASLARAIMRAYFRPLWSSGILKLASELTYTLSPLVTKRLLAWITQSYRYHRIPESLKASGEVTPPPGVGYGVGVAFGLFAMLQMASVLSVHAFQLTTTTGLSIRSAIIGTIFRKTLRLSGRAKNEHSSGKITTMISGDATRIDRFTTWGHLVWVAPIQILIGIGLLVNNIGYSALVGLAVILIGAPLQTILAKAMMTQIKTAIGLADKRVRVVSEALQGIRLIKFYAWEEFVVSKAVKFRFPEIKALRQLAYYRAFLLSFSLWLPILAAVLSFITYALTDHELDVAIIFSSLQLFNIIRTPLLMFPVLLNFFTEVLVALKRISTFLRAEDIGDPYPTHSEAGSAIEVNGTFTWETVANDSLGTKKEKRGGAVQEKAPVLPVTGLKEKELGIQQEVPFSLDDLRLSIPNGAFVAIIGTVGGGKSSILQAIIGDMRKTAGDVTLGGSLAYVPQTAWIRNATLRDNITFGLDDDESRFRNIVYACSLEHDLEVLPQGEQTEIGEKGINLSGGQRARVSLARAAYSNADIVLLDDPLAAVDAHVGNFILDNCLLNGPLATRTRVLVTHALHVLEKTDRIYVVDKGKIVEQGTYQELKTSGPMFSHLMDEYGQKDALSEDKTAKAFDETSDSDTMVKSAQVKKVALMQEEERNVGSVTWGTYVGYFAHAGGTWWIPVIGVLAAVVQCAVVGNTVFLGFWTAQSIKGFAQRDYMIVYASFGIAQALFTFALMLIFYMVTLTATERISVSALRGVLYSPVSFFDTTPIGRILSRLSKDQDTLDRELLVTTSQLLLTAAGLLGTVGLVFYVFPYLGLIFPPLAVLYYAISKYFRSTSVETKRLDSILRSALYASFSETFTGVATIRAYRTEAAWIQNTEHALDLENQAYYMSLSIQSWLTLRLGALGNILVLGIALFAVGFRTSASPSNIGVVLTYALGILQVFAEMVMQFALNEQNMNAVERILVYTQLPAEGDPTPKIAGPPAEWPAHGAIRFEDVELSYRKDLPLVLKNVSLAVNPGEKVGIVGRTGAGKSSLLQALFRTVEVSGGTIAIDGINIRDVSLETLRGRLALVPQESTMFMGTLRDNLDPHRQRTDAELISALQRAWLLPKSGDPSDGATESKFSLDSTVSDDGSNFSAGEKQLLALCRALVKNSRIIVLDEATSSVDVETDAKLQRTIQTEFASSTLLCIAHRINTIAYYDRILVMDAGQVAEFDTVLNLYDKEDSIFRSLCNDAGLTRTDIVHIRQSHQSAVSSD